MVRYVRPRPDAPLHAKIVVPKAIGKARDLYAYSSASTELERQRLELQLFGPIDQRAAEAIKKIDASQFGSAKERVGLVQFLLSLQLRSPSRLSHLRGELTARMNGVADFDASDDAHKIMIADQVNDLLSEMISSQNTIQIVASMKVFRIDVVSRFKLLTCDLPLMMLQGIAQPQGFLMLPYSPNRLAIFVHDEQVALALSSQEHDVLAKSLNDAVVRQAQEFVIAADNLAKRFVENRFLKNSEPLPGDGLMRWKVP